MDLTKKEKTLLVLMNGLKASYASEIAKKMGWFQSQASVYLNRLEQKGYIKKASNNPNYKERGYVINCINRNALNLKKFKGLITDIVTLYVINEDNPNLKKAIDEACADE